MPLTIAVLAHVDAGKTTFSEQLLYAAGVIRKQGRVDHGDTVMDSSAVERERGITVWSDQAGFTLGGTRYTLIDTPGHSDFASETERALSSLDMAFLLLDGSSALPAYTATLFSMAREHRIPVFILINKTDLAGYDRESCFSSIVSRLTDTVIPIRNGEPDEEALSLLDDAFCEHWLDGSTASGESWQVLGRLFASLDACPCMEISALNGIGISGVMTALQRLSPFCERMPDTSSGFRARVSRVRRDSRGERVVYLRILQGVLTPRQSFTFGDLTEKIHQIRFYTGNTFTAAEEALPGDTVGVTGLSVPRCGDLITESGVESRESAKLTPVLQAQMVALDGVSPVTLLEKARILEDEDPALGVSWDEVHGVVRLRIMGTVQVEILTRVMEERFGLRVRFEPPEVLYKETVTAPVIGCGHYEPLRHYAETHLRLEPAPRGSGISFSSECHVDDLPISFQNLIRTHVFERTHPGVLTGSPLTDVRITLLSGRHHLKHTEGGDFRETVYRAIRQALMKADCVLLEPCYRFTVTAPMDCLGRIMTDLSGLHAECGSPELMGDTVQIQGRVPVACMMDWPVTLRSLTRGQGDIRLLPDGYDRCHNQQEVVARIAYNAEADTVNPAGSVFCSHGAGYNVAWYKADDFMHLPVESCDPVQH